ncbi:M28 family metallopeptidase [Biformimicrobium ophioploci]|uniref:M20/M25/M40 family metallo-hydrolase n=1 Tax=Biformimicrobium ophioploci TaxID=3036711 RepID=A0ABQ6LVB5_9GAMM|nr:M28 family metallopeptidase [Microbulbifer sp. NKW57]GMG85987.1 M20/M25/M40 family metallo-hydrolase [Microbulbifer sp. NKW57]
MKKTISLLAAALLAACSTEPVSTVAVPTADPDTIRAHVTYLASDELQGRDTGSEGYEQAADYVAAQFREIGLQPAGEDGFKQTVPFRRASHTEQKPTAVLHTADDDIELAFGEDFLAGAGQAQQASAVTAEMVFAGYGIDAPRFGINDYEGLEVDGKIVVVLSGRHASLPTEEGAHYRSGRTKLQTAAARGAVGMISVHTPQAEKRRPFERSAKYAERPNLRWVGKDGVPSDTVPGVHPGIYLDIGAAEKLFAGAPQQLAQVFEAVEKGEKLQGFDLAVRASLSNHSQHEQITSPNVVAMLPGSDPQLKDEFVVFSAHLDHIGLDAHAEEGADHINNGALDNATGVAIMLETARMFAEGERPRRSILFVAVTGEERGLLGSDYFAQYPTVPGDKMVANINLDMPLVLYPFNDVIAFGAEHSSLGETVARAAANAGIKLSPDPMPEQGLFTRSDHYSFVRQGVPSVFLVVGFESADPDIDGGEVFTNFLKTDYHRPSDQIDLPINYLAAKKFTEVNYEIGREVANTEERQRWNQGNFFGDLFGG